MPNNPYADIINLPHHVSTVHPQMSMAQRAAQISPFSALVGYEDVIDETARQTNSKREPDETEKVELDRKLGILASHLKEKPAVELEFFVPDKTKAGGEYVFKLGTVEKILPVQGLLWGSLGGEGAAPERV